MMFRMFFVISCINITLYIHVVSMFVPCSKYGIVRNQPNTTCIDELIKQAHIPGLSVQVVKGEQVLYSYQSGYATLDSQAKGNLPVTRNSIFLWCSITKTVCAMAIMQLVEIGLLDLDTDINKYITENNFTSIYNPSYPDDTITLRHLLTHTASIGGIGADTYLVPYDDFTEISLGNYLENFLQINGDYYIEENWLNHSIGSYSSYSNIGISLAAWIVELVTKTDYMKYTQDNIFKPLGLDDISWTIKGYTKEQQTNIVYPYIFNETADNFHDYIPFVPVTQLSNNWLAVELYSVQPYPAGQLRSNIQSLSVLLSMFINNGTYNGTQILQPKSIHEISTIQYPNITGSAIGSSSAFGVVYFYSKSFGYPFFAKDYFGHSGGSYGYVTWMLFDPQTSIGVCLLSNGNSVTSNHYQASLVDNTLIHIENYLFQIFDA